MGPATVAVVMAAAKAATMVAMKAVPIAAGPQEESHANRSPRTGRNDYGRSAPAPRDPFFDKPYETPVAADAATPAWEATARPAARSISANIKHKVKVPMLFKASTHEA